MIPYDRELTEDKGAEASVYGVAFALADRRPGGRRIRCRACDGGLFVPNRLAPAILGITQAAGRDRETYIVGIRNGETLHETMIGVEDARNRVEMGSFHVVLAQFPWWDDAQYPDGTRMPDGLTYRSDTKRHSLKVQEIGALQAQLKLG